MALRKHVTLPELQPWLNTRLQDYEELKLRKKADITVVFVSRMVDVSHVSSKLKMYRRTWCWQGHAMHPSCEEIRLSPHIRR
jgi:hypothetical protein